MTMECLRDYIGIKGCGIDPPASGMYINSLPGIEFNSIDQIANADQTSYAGVWSDVQERAIERFRLDVLGVVSGFNSRYRLKQITQTVDLGKEIGATIAPSANQSGLVIELNNPGDTFVCSNMQTLYIQSIPFYSLAIGAYTIVVRDADLGTVLDTFNGTSAIGWNTISPDKSYDGVRRISITQNTTAISTSTLDLASFNLQGFANNINFSWGYTNGLWFNYGCTGTAQVRGFQTDINYQSAVYGSNTFGISCVFSVQCTYNNVVCKNKRYFATAFRLCLGIELMTERLYSSRINKWTTVDLKRASELKKEFELQYRGGKTEDAEYEGELKRACYSIDLDLTDCCLEADGMYQWRETQL